MNSDCEERPSSSPRVPGTIQVQTLVNVPPNTQRPPRKCRTEAKLVFPSGKERQLMNLSSDLAKIPGPMESVFYVAY